MGDDRGTDCGRCVVFLHFHKAGGTTILKVLESAATGAEQSRCGGLYYCNWRNFDTSGCLKPYAAQDSVAPFGSAMTITIHRPACQVPERCAFARITTMSQHCWLTAIFILFTFVNKRKPQRETLGLYLFLPTDPHL